MKIKIGDRVKVVESIYSSDALQPGVYGTVSRNSFFFGLPGFNVVLEDPEAPRGPHEQNAWNFAVEQLELTEAA